jgi:hypothetical protein
MSARMASVSLRIMGRVKPDSLWVEESRVREGSREWGMSEQNMMVRWVFCECASHWFVVGRWNPRLCYT